MSGRDFWTVPISLYVLNHLQTLECSDAFSLRSLWNTYCGYSGLAVPVQSN